MLSLTKGLTGRLGLVDSVVGGVAPAVPDITDFPEVFAGFAPSYESNTTETYTVSFDPADVDTATNEIDLGEDAQFLAFISSTSVAGLPIQITTTGTLPSGAVASTNYYLSPTTGTKYKFYPVPADNTGIDHSLDTENVFELQNYAQQTNEVDFTSQGTGVHTISTGLIAEYLNNKVTANEFRAKADNSLNRHSYFNLKTDGASRKYTPSRNQLRDPEGNDNNDIYGKAYGIEAYGSNVRLDWKELIAEKRVIGQTYVLKLVDFVSQGRKKVFVENTEVNTTTGQFDVSSHGLNDGWVVNIINHDGSTLPTGLSEGTDYVVEKINNNDFELYPTEADRVAKTNVIIPPAQNSGTFTVVAINQTVGNTRQANFAEIIDPAGGTSNSMSPRIFRNTKSAVTFDQRAFNTNGTVGRAGVQITNWIGDFPTDFSNGVAKVTLDFIRGGAFPTREDTATEIESGDFWVTQETGSSVLGRFHATEQDALDCVGFAQDAAECTGKIIRYTDLGGDFQVVARYTDFVILDIAYEALDGVGGVIGGNGQSPRLLPLDNEVHNYTILIDFNDPAETEEQIYVYIDGALQVKFAGNGAKGLTQPASDGNIGTLLNSQARHVPANVDAHGFYFFSSTSAIDASWVSSWHDDYIKPEHDI